MRSAFVGAAVSGPARRRTILAVVVGLLVGSLMLMFAHARPAQSAATTPPGFADTLVTSVGSPTALAFTPDGRLLVTTQNGRLRVYENGALLDRPALDLANKTCTNGGRGLVGIAVDPNFAANNYIYLYYAFKKHGVCDQNTANAPVNRVERYVLSASNVASPDRILVDNIPNPYQHSAGDLRFGKDGYLYVSVGDGGCDYAGDSGCGGQNDAPRDPHALLGKILRVTRDGGIPPGNPYQGADSVRCNLTGTATPGKKCQETFASGLRNPYRFAFDPNATGTRFFVNDVGESRWEEINEGRLGADYGWNLCEGNHDNPNMPGAVSCGAAPYTPPVHEYSHSTGCSSTTGAAFVPNGLWPAAYNNSYLFGDYVCGKIFKLSPNGAGGLTRTDFVTGLGENSAVAMTFGPHAGTQALYYTTFGNGGEIRRVAYTGNVNRPPSAVLAANPTSGPSPLTVDFDGSGSDDPDAGDTLTYRWSFGDGSPAETTTAPTTRHTYTTDGAYTATLRVEDGRGAVSDPDTVRIDAGNRAPIPSIESPLAGSRFRVGQEYTLRGSATDPEDGQLQDGSLGWQILQHHDGDHTHPLLAETGNGPTFVAPPPEGLVSTGEGSYLEIRLTATDSRGLSRTVSQDLHPTRVNVTFGSNRSGLSLQVDGEAFTAPRTFVSWEGYELNAYAPSPQTLSGRTHVFASWSDGKAQQHGIITGATAATYTANFAACTRTGTTAADVLDGTSGADVICGLGGNDTIRGLGGNDTIEGMSGNDRLRGGGGADKARGATGADDLYGDGGNDALDSQDGVNGNDALDGGPGTDTRITDATERSITGFP